MHADLALGWQRLLLDPRWQQHVSSIVSCAKTFSFWGAEEAFARTGMLSRRPRGGRAAQSRPLGARPTEAASNSSSAGECFRQGAGLCTGLACAIFANQTCRSRHGHCSLHLWREHQSKLQCPSQVSPTTGYPHPSLQGHPHTRLLRRLRSDIRAPAAFVR